MIPWFFMNTLWSMQQADKHSCIEVSTKFNRILDSGGSIVVEHLSHQPKVGGLSPATSTDTRRVPQFILGIFGGDTADRGDQLYLAMPFC